MVRCYTVYECEVCGHLFRGGEAEKLAIRCEVSGHPGFKFQAGAMWTIKRLASRIYYHFRIFRRYVLFKGVGIHISRYQVEISNHLGESLFVIDMSEEEVEHFYRMRA